MQEVKSGKVGVSGSKGRGGGRGGGGGKQRAIDKEAEEEAQTLGCCRKLRR